MKKITFFALLAAGFLFTSCNSDEVVFSMDTPKGWKEISDAEAIGNLGRYKLKQEDLDKYLAQHKESIALLSYVKYDPDKHEGLIPTIKVNIRPNDTKNLNEFILAIQASAEEMKNYFADFHYIDRPAVVKIDGKDAVYFCAGFSMESAGGTTFYPRSYTYAIPDGDKLYQVNFIDGNEEDCSALFAQLVKSIQLD